MTDILSAIDDALLGRCACGCEAVLDPGGPSAWYATPECETRVRVYRSGDVARWTPDLEDEESDTEPDYNGEYSYRRTVGRPGPNMPMQPSRVWINGQEVTDYVRSIDLTPPMETTSYGQETWREVMNGLRSASMTLSGYWDWAEGETVNVTQGRIGRGHIAVVDETRHWAGEQAHERIQRLVQPDVGSFPYWASPVYDPDGAEHVITGNPSITVQVEEERPSESASEHIESLRQACRWIEDHVGRQLAPWQRTLLDQSFTVSAEPSTDFFREEMTRYRIQMRYAARHLGLAFQPFVDGFPELGEKLMPHLERIAQASRALIDLKRRARMRYLHCSYRHRQLARRRRNR